jgi:hypothetical protein
MKGEGEEGGRGKESKTTAGFLGMVEMEQSKAGQDEEQETAKEGRGGLFG